MCVLLTDASARASRAAVSHARSSCSQLARRARQRRGQARRHAGVDVLAGALIAAAPERRPARAAIARRVGRTTACARRASAAARRRSSARGCSRSSATCRRPDASRLPTCVRSGPRRVPSATPRTVWQASQRCCDEHLHGRAARSASAGGDGRLRLRARASARTRPALARPRAAPCARAARRRTRRTARGTRRPRALRSAADARCPGTMSTLPASAGTQKLWITSALDRPSVTRRPDRHVDLVGEHDLARRWPDRGSAPPTTTSLRSRRSPARRRRAAASMRRCAPLRRQAGRDSTTLGKTKPPPTTHSSCRPVVAHRRAGAVRARAAPSRRQRSRARRRSAPMPMLGDRCRPIGAGAACSTFNAGARKYAADVARVRRRNAHARHQRAGHERRRVDDPACQRFVAFGTRPAM